MPVGIVNITGASAPDWTNDWDQAVRLLWAHSVYVSDVTAANRQIIMQLLDVSNAVVHDVHAGAVQAASLTRHYNFMPGTFRETSFIDDEIHVPFPMDFWIPPGFKIKFKDDDNTVAGDTTTVNLQIERP